MRLVIVYVAVAFACLGVACSPRVTDFERMRQQQRVGPYRSSPVFPDRSAMRSPPRGAVTYAPDTSAPDSATAARSTQAEEVIPASQVQSVGRQKFHTFCSVCHGDDGAAGTVMGGNMPDKPAPSLLTTEAAHLSDGEMFDLVTHGKQRMPSYDWPLSASERWAVVAHVRELQRVAAVGTAQSER